MSRYKQAEHELKTVGYLARDTKGYWRSSPTSPAFQERVMRYLLRTGQAKVFISTLKGKPMRIIRKDDRHG